MTSTTATGVEPDVEPDGSDEAPAHGRSSVFWRLWIGSTVSQFGSGVTIVALPLVALRIAHASTFEIGLVSAATVTAWLVVGLPAGVIVHRLPLRPVLLAGNVIRAVALASIPVAAAFGALTLVQLIIVALIVGVASVMFDVGYSTYMPSVLPPEQLTAGNSFTQGSGQVAQIAGPSLGGTLVQLVGAANAMITDALSYVFSTTMLLSLPAPPQTPQPAEPVRMTAQIRHGLSYTFRDPVIGPLAISATVANFVTAGIEAITVVFLVRTVHVGSAMLGLLIAAGSVGGVIGAALTTRLSSRFGSARVVLLSLVLSPLATLLLPLTERGAGLAFFAIGSAVAGASDVTFSIIARTHRQIVVPRPLLPQVMATVRFISWGVLPLGAIIAAALGQALGVRTTLWIFGVINIFGLIAAATPSIRRARNLVDVA